MTQPGYKLNRDEAGLTEMEREVLLGLRMGVRQAQIARDLGVTRQRVGQLKQALQEAGYSTEKVEEESDGATDD